MMKTDFFLILASSASVLRPLRAIDSGITMPKLFPDPVCVLPGEYGFVAAVLAAPLDDLPKLVYADWLEERNDPRGLFLRAWAAAKQAGKKRPKPYKSLSKCWLSVIGYTLDAWLVQQGNPAWADAVRATAEPCLVVRTIRLNDGETVPTGGSKMGGLPDLDPDIAWPGGDEGELAFVAQWNLGELSVSPCAAKLPKKGLLSFFMDLAPLYFEDAVDWSPEVIVTPDVSGVEEREPEELEEDNELPACRVEFRELLSIPHYTSPVLKRVLTDKMREEYNQLSYPQGGLHRILGYPDPLQNDPTPTDSRKRWSLLSEFGPDDTLRLKDCDGGTWYFMIPNTDLKKGKFGDTYMEFQTG